jgi:threonine efflux protein
MNELTFLGSVAALYFLLAASPGPNFIVITHAAASRSRSYAVALSAGVSTASVVWAGLAAAGLGVVIVRYGELYRWLQLAGGAYLLYLGLKMLRGSGRASPASTGASLSGGVWDAWRLGLWTNMTNPKSLAFFSSAFAALFSPELPSCGGTSRALLGRGRGE